MVFSPAPPTPAQKLDGTSLDTLLKDAQTDPSMRSLHLRHAGLTPNLAVQIANFLEGNCSVTELDLTGNAIGFHGASCLAASLQKNGTLQQLTLAGCGLKSDAIAPFAEYFSNQPSGSPLRSIDFSNNQIDDDAAEALAALVTAVSNSYAEDAEPMALDLRKNWFGDDAMRAIATAMQTNHRLLVIRVEGNQDENATVAKKQIAFCLQRNRVERERRVLLHHIQFLGDASLRMYDYHLQHVELTLSEAQLLSSALGDNRSLVSLQLRDNALPSEGTRRILKSLERHPSLRTLQIQDNDVGDGGFAALNNLLRSSPSLVNVVVIQSVHASPLTPTMSRRTLASLHHTLARDTLPLRALALDNCGLKDLEIGVIASGIAWACCLESLELRNNYISDASVHVFVRLLHRCSRLHTLDVTGSRLTLEGALILAQATTRHAAMRTLLLGRFPQYEASTIDAIVACFQESKTLVRVDLTTKERASRCADHVRSLHNAWRSRRDAFECARNLEVSQQRVHDEKHANYRTTVRRAAVHVVTQWLHQPKPEPLANATSE